MFGVGIVLSDNFLTHPNNQIRQLIGLQRITKKRFGRFIYFSADEAARKRQIAKRTEVELAKIKAVPPTRLQLIRIVLALIEHYSLSSERLYQILSNTKKTVPRKVIEWVYETFEIAKKGSP